MLNIANLGNAALNASKKSFTRTKTILSGSSAGTFKKNRLCHVNDGV